LKVESRKDRVYARAPGRIDLAGGGTDPEPYASDYGGLVLNLAISCHTHVTIRARGDGRVRIRALDLEREVEGPAGEKLTLDGRLDLPAAMVNRFRLPGGADIETWTELPPASGLSSSASLGVALLGGLARYTGMDLDRAGIADLHSEVERFDLKIWGGKQDPFACAHGGLRLWRFEGERTVEEQLALSEGVAAELERDLLLIYSGEAHLSGNIHNEILADYRRGDSKVKAAQHRLKEVASLAQGALEAGDLREFAALLDANWEAHQRLHPSCATSRLHDLIALGKAQGAWGAKVCGAGGGGCIVFHVPPERRRQVSRALAERGAVLLPFKIDRQGVQVWSGGECRT
jgi:D-glycero-alpha-D-manno-heptose-7-phosphate kinase